LVYWNGQPRPTLWGGGEVVGTISRADVSVPGPVVVSVVNPKNGQISNTAVFVVTAPLAPTPSQTSIELIGDAGDNVTRGSSYLYTKANAIIAASASNGYFNITISGDVDWRGDFQLPTGVTQFAPAAYTGLTRWPFHDPTKGGLSWTGQGRGCNTLTGSFTVLGATYTAGALTTLDLQFEQHCEGIAPALRGTVHWRANDPTQPAGPIDPVPAGLWQPAAGALPPAARFVYLQSDVGDLIGQGQTNTYTSGISLTTNGGLLETTVGGWTGDFRTMLGVDQIKPGYYSNLLRYPIHNPLKGGLSWFGNGRSCSSVRGWFAVDAVTYVGATLTSLDLRFEQHCEGQSPGLRGVIHWR